MQDNLFDISIIFINKIFIFENFIFKNFVSFYFIFQNFHLIFFSIFFVVNSVHEHCSNSDSKIVLSPKTGSKPSQVHSALAQDRPGTRDYGRVVGAMAVSWPWPPAVSHGVVPCRRSPSAVSQGAALTPYRGLAGRVATQQPQPSSLFCHNTPRCIAIQSLPPQPLPVTIQPKVS